MLRPNLLLAGLIFLLSGVLACQAEPLQDPKTVLENSPNAPVEPSPASFVLELDQAILVLKRGLKEQWKTPDQYLIAFEKTPGTDSTGRSVTDAEKYVECAIGAHLRTQQIWDEGPPLGIEVDRMIIEFTKLRNEAEQARLAKDGPSTPDVQAAEFRLPSCVASPPRKVMVSAGIASRMLETKIDPVYPTDGNVSGTVVLQATISAEGRVEALRVISGPAPLQQAALDAVRQWTYRPFQLNNIAVEVETTINVDFASHR